MARWYTPGEDGGGAEGWASALLSVQMDGVFWWVVATLGCASAALFLYYRMMGAVEQEVASELSQLLGSLFGEEKPTKGRLQARLHKEVLEQCEKPFVLAFERAAAKLGRPTKIRTSTVKMLVAPDGLVRVRCVVEFENDEALVDACWEDFSVCAEKTPATRQPLVMSLQIEPESGPLDILAELNPSVFEQKSDAFLASMFSGKYVKACDYMHENLQEKIQPADLKKQKETLCKVMGVTSEHHDPDATYHTSSVETERGVKTLLLTAGLPGDHMAAEAKFYWVLDGLSGKLIKFEIKTTGKPTRETVFVNPDGTRIDQYN